MTEKRYNKEDYMFPLYGSFTEFIDDIGEKYAERPALSWYTRRKEEKTYSYGELKERVEDLRLAMCSRQIAGKKVAIAAENRAEWILTYLAAVSCGCTAVCIDIEQPDEGIRDMIRDVSADTVFISLPLLEICGTLLHEQTVKHVVVFDNVPDAEGVESWDSFYGSGCSLKASGERPAMPAENEVAELIFTSGTSGKPKIVMLGRAAILQNIRDASSNVNLCSRVFSSLPLYHAYGLNSAVLCSFLQGAHLCINGDIRTAFRDMWLFDPDTVFAVPLIVEAMLGQVRQKIEASDDAEFMNKLMKAGTAGKKLRQSFYKKQVEEICRKTVGNMRLIICGGASLDIQLAEKFELFGVQVLQGYGITECSPLISVNCSYANKPGTVGLPMRSSEVKIEDGEIWVKGPSVMMGYYNDPEQTALAMEDGWFKTGDLGHFDKDGFLTLTGRKKNLIVFKNGNKVSPEKLESLIMRIPIVKEALVYGSMNGSSADDVKITASIYPDPAMTAGMAAYEVLGRVQSEIEKINEDLPSYQQIQMVTIREKELAKTSMHKVKRGDNQ